jgi:hypothetical protein
MSEFAQRFLNEDWENLPQAPRVYVGAFGKHPAWNDHMDDVGLLTSSLVMLRRSLYGTGIASQIESAAWDRAGADKTLSTFDHTLVWRRGGESLTGRIWSSRDGIGRALFPMTVVVHTVGQRFEFLSQEVAPALEAARAGCLLATVATPVLASLAEAQRTLRQRAGVTDSVGVVDSLIGIDGWTAYFSLDRIDLERVFTTCGSTWGCSRPVPMPGIRRRAPRSPAAFACPGSPVAVRWRRSMRGCPSSKPRWTQPYPCSDWSIARPPGSTSSWASRLRPTFSSCGRICSVRPWSRTCRTSSMLKGLQRMEPLLADIVRRRRLPTVSILNGQPVVENREAADRWLARHRNGGRTGFLSRLIPTSGSRAGSRFDLRAT